MVVMVVEPPEEAVMVVIEPPVEAVVVMVMVMVVVLRLLDHRLALNGGR